MGSEDFAAPPKPPFSKEKDSQAPVEVAPASHTHQGRNTTRAPSPSIPKSQRVVRKPSENRLPVVPPTPQTQRGSDAPKPGSAGEEMDCTLPALQSTMSSASAGASGKSQDAAKKKIYTAGHDT